VATKRLKKSTVEALSPNPKVYFVWDEGRGYTPGFGIKVLPSGVKMAVYQYRLKGAGRKAIARRITIGELGRGLNHSQAIKIIEGFRAEVLAGGDPAKDRKARILEQVENERLGKEHTFNALSDDWLKTKQDLKSLIQYKRILNSHLGHLKNRDVKGIRPGELEDLFSEVHGRAPQMSRQVIAVLRSILDHGIKHKRPPWLAENPASHIKSNVRPSSRDRVLTDKELVKVWNAADGMGWPYGRAVQLLFLTGARRSEIIGLDFSEIDLDKCVWNLPSERAKNGKSHLLHISDQAKGILLNLKKKDEKGLPKSGLAFSTTGMNPISGLSKYKARLDEKSGVSDWRLHDIRRTVATNLHEMGFGMEVVEKLLNHVGVSGSGVAGIYDKSKLLPQRKDALDMWGQRVMTIIESEECHSTVVSIKGRASND
jgi:integrase